MHAQQSQRALPSVGGWLAAAALLCGPAPAQPPAGAALPQIFVANRGQWPAAAGFRCRKGPVTAWFVRDGWVLALERPAAMAAVLAPGEPVPNPTAARPLGPRQGVAVRMTIEGALGERPPLGEQELPGRHHFLLGSDPLQWITDVPGCARLRYAQVHPGVDVVVRGSAGIFEYDLLLAPGADPGLVVLRCEGVDSIERGADGSLLLHTALGPLRQAPATTWHVLPTGARVPVACEYRVLGQGRFGFAVPDRNRHLPLVIDPDLRWSTFLGGSADEIFNGVAHNPDGTVTVAGESQSIDFPTTLGSYQPAPAGGRDVVVSRIDETRAGAAQLVWATYIGGSGDDVAFDVAVDDLGLTTVVAGYTDSIDLPTRNAPYPTHNGGMDAFVCRLLPGGAGLVYSTYLGGAGDDWACAVGEEAALTTTVAGYTASAGFPATTGAYDTTFNGATDAFVARVNGAGQLAYATFLGGASNEGILWNNWQSYPLNIRVLGLDVDASGRAAITGLTWPAVPSFPTTSGAYDRTFNGNWDAFVSVLDPSQSGPAQLVYSTLIGGSRDEGGASLAWDGGALVLGGWTYSSGFPTTPGAFNRVFQGGTNRNDAFVARLDPGLTGTAQLVYSTLLSGSDWEAGLALDVDARGFATVAGFCGPGFPTTAGGFQTVFGGGQDAFVLKLSMAGGGTADLIYSTYVGGTDLDLGADVALDGLGGGHVVGGTASWDFPTAGNVFQSTLAGTWDGFAAHLDLLPVGATRIDGSRPHCRGPIVFEVSAMPVAATTFSFLGGNAPPSGIGALVLGYVPSPSVPVLGAALCVNPVATLAVAADPQGTFAWPLATQPTWQGFRFGMQAVFVNAPACTVGSILSSSAALDVTLQ